MYEFSPAVLIRRGHHLVLIGLLFTKVDIKWINKMLKCSSIIIKYRFFFFGLGAYNFLDKKNFSKRRPVTKKKKKWRVKSKRNLNFPSQARSLAPKGRNKVEAWGMCDDKGPLIVTVTERDCSEGRIISEFRWLRNPADSNHKNFIALANRIGEEQA